MRDLEPVEEFAARARVWLAENLEPTRNEGGTFWHFDSDEEEMAAVEDLRAQQRRLYDGGFAGICFPKEYGGQGLTPKHQAAFNAEAAGYRMPVMLNVPTFVPCGAVLLEFGTEDQKKRHIPAILRGEEIWMQFLSEPSGGSDVAGALTRADRDGGEWILNGSKVWTSGAWWADYGLCLARTNWEVPKHQGLTVFILKIDQPGVEVQRLEMINGTKDFCQEFFTDVRIDDEECRVGEIDDGWTVGRRWMFHERHAMGGGSPYTSGPAHGAPNMPRKLQIPVIAHDTGQADDPRAIDLVGEAEVLSQAQDALRAQLGEAMASGQATDASAAIARLMSAVYHQRVTDIRFDLAGSSGAAWADDDPASELGTMFLMRQTSSIGGGTSEMARNNISERVLGMPRERTLDKDIPFREVPKGPAGSR